MSDVRSEQNAGSSPETEALVSVPPGENDAAVSARIDPAHTSPQQPKSLARDASLESVAASPSPAVSPASTAGTAQLPAQDQEVLRERLRRQARQLGEYLRRRQADLDRREAQLNARLAQLENDERASRLLFSERLAEWEEKRQALAEEHATIARKRAELAEREDAIQQREQVLSQWEESLRQKDALLRQKEQELERRKNELLRREADLQFREKDFTSLAVVVENGHTDGSSPLLADASTAGEELTQIQQMKQEATELLKGLREALRQFKQEERLWRQQWLAEQQEVLDDLMAQRDALTRRGQFLNQYEKQLQQLKAEIQARYLAALEQRLAAQELLARLQPAQIAEFSEKLINLHKQREAILQAQHTEKVKVRDELEILLKRLLELQRTIQTERDQLENAFQTRRQQIERLAEALKQREKQLAEKQYRLDALHHAWQLHRLGYRLQITRLKRRIRELEQQAQSGDSLLSPPPDTAPRCDWDAAAAQPPPA